MSTYNIPIIKLDSGQQSREEIKARLVVIDQVIAKLEESFLMNTESGSVGVVEYEIHTGQTKQKVRHTEADVVISSLMRWQKYREYLASKLTPRVTRLMGVNKFGKLR